MKQFYLATIMLLFLARLSSAQFFTQYFDGADTVFDTSLNIELDSSLTNVWQIGTPQKIIFDSAATAPYAIVTDTFDFYPINNTSRFIVRILNQFSPWGVLALQWKQKLDMDSERDGGIVEFTIDHGVTWQNAFNNPYVYNFYGFQPANMDTLYTGDYAFSGTDSSWRDIWLCWDLSWMIQFPDTLMLRFTLLSDGNDDAKEGWMIDNFMAHETFIHTVKETEQENYLNVFPNPAGSIVHIQARKIMDYHIIEKMELIDPMGRVADQWTFIPTRFWIDTNKYRDGLYYLKVKTNFKTEVVPLMIHKETR